MIPLVAITFAAIGKNIFTRGIIMVTLICIKAEGDTIAREGQKYKAQKDQLLKAIERYKIPDLKYSVVGRDGILRATLENAIFEIVN
ncbi:hypothetical protein bas33_0170 [Escherichia phage HildyBeyeler]|uniref:Uncharacterized protein n=1 Tax=Escherichia phage HildyBeyeler TaxID=2852005 RepID=A0AAE8B0F1_9CAUD|nr:hypothetical protein bas33_0170 [Escherichia phage HildyBeyeler]